MDKFFAILLVLFVACNSRTTDKAITQRPIVKKEPIDSTYIKEYAGTYVIKVDADKSNNDEQLILTSKGECTWRSGSDRKEGTWSATKNKIKTIVKGNSGDIPEDFNFEKDRFVSEDSRMRYLVKTK